MKKKKEQRREIRILVYVVWEEDKKRVERSPQYKSNHGTMWPRGGEEETRALLWIFIIFFDRVVTIINGSSSTTTANK